MITDSKAPVVNNDSAQSTSAPVANSTIASGRKVQTGESDLTPNAEQKPAQIATVSQALESPVKSEEVKEVKEVKREDKNEAPIESAAQLREYHARKGTAPTPEDVAAVKELEAKVLEEGGKRLRINEQAK